MERNHVITYLVVFLTVFVPFLVLRLFLSAQISLPSDLQSRNLPFLFQKLYWFFALFSTTWGKQQAKLQPHRREKLKNYLLTANIKMEPEMVFAAEILLGLIGALIPALVLLGLTDKGCIILLGVLICGFIGGVYPSTNIASAADKRRTAIIKNLPFAIDLIGSAMRSGLDFSAAVRYYVSMETTGNPLAVEFGVMLKQMELGKTRIEALEDMAERIQSDEFSSFSAAVAHGTEVGASIVDTMRIQGEEMRRARFNIAERKAARAPSMMILPIALFIMPAVFIVIGTPVFLKIQSSGLGGFIR
ncbi:type II secretion system F family protein [bacterium]|nr:type II secretion system F family protein [bacterium]